MLFSLLQKSNVQKIDLYQRKYVDLAATVLRLCGNLFGSKHVNERNARAEDALEVRISKAITFSLIRSLLFWLGS